MSYAAAIDELNALAPELHTRAGEPRRKFSLDQVRTLLGALGNPQFAFRSVLIAGTNGKGSTASTLASILTASGVRTGLYTSPHLERPNERIRLDGVEIADDAFAELYFRVRDAGEKLLAATTLPQLPSYFEILTALAFLYYAQERADVAVLEVGMGGRLDATNVVEPLLSIITDISLDHTEWLGPTIGAIAREKAGILRAGGTMVTLPQHPEANQVLGEVATELGVHGVNAVPFMPTAAGGGIGRSYPVKVLGATIEVDSPLLGAHQHRNVALAMAAAIELAQTQGLPITAESIAEGIRKTNWPGRLERINRIDRIDRGGTEWILDVAHNPACAWALRSGLREMFGERRLETLVFSCLRDKPVAEMAQILFPMFEQVILTPLDTVRATALDDLVAAAQLTGTKYHIVESVGEALRLAREQARGGTAVISGSVHLVGEARGRLVRGEGSA